MDGRYAPESMDAVYNLGEILLLIQIGELEDEALRQPDPSNEHEEVMDVIRMPIL